MAGVETNWKLTAITEHDIDFPEVNKRFRHSSVFLSNFQSGRGAHPASYVIYSGGCHTGGKATGE
jgi:hypothetical protein